MQEETKLLIKAIESLKSEPSIFKDYIFPIASAFFSSVLGGVIAVMFFRYQERIAQEKSKLNAANKWILLADEARATLISIKQNYHGALTENPIQRALAIPTVLFSSQPIKENYSELSFVVPSAENGTIHKWSQIPRIRAMICNYNYLQELWLKRNDIERPIKETLLKKSSDKAHVDIGLDEVLECVGHVEITSLIDLTEHVVKLTDDLLVELDNFLTEFPAFVKSILNTKKINEYGSVLTFSSEGNVIYQEILQRSPAPNFETIEGIFGASKEALRKRYDTGY